jgi:hypothetical protein
MRLSVAFDLATFQRGLDAEAARLARMARRAVNEGAWHAREAVKKEMKDVFINPTPYILGSMTINPAVDTGNEASLDWRWGGAMTKSGGEILRPHIEGGSRLPKPFELVLRRAGLLAAHEFAVTAKVAPKDRYGNIAGPMMVQILSALRAFNEMGFSGNRKRNIGDPAPEYFAITSYANEHMSRRPSLPAGIYRKRRAYGLQPVMILRFVERAPAYEAESFTPGTVARDAFLREMPNAWRLALAGQIPNRSLR